MLQIPHARPALQPNHRRLAGEALEHRHLLAIDFELLKDINTTPNGPGSNPRSLTEAGGAAFFSASTPTGGRALEK